LNTSLAFLQPLCRTWCKTYFLVNERLKSDPLSCPSAQRLTGRDVSMAWENRWGECLWED